jgi:hypothetical protein
MRGALMEKTSVKQREAPVKEIGLLRLSRSRKITVNDRFLELLPILAGRSSEGRR